MRKNLLIVSIFIVITIGILSKNKLLKKNEVWSIQLEKISAKVVGDASYTLPNVYNTILSNYSVYLKKSGDKVTFTFQIVNKGTKSAKLTDIIKSIPKCSEESLCNNIEYNIMNEDGTKLEKNMVLFPNSKKRIKIVIEYPNNIALKKAMMIDNIDIDFLFSKVL